MRTFNFKKERENMVLEQIKLRGISDERILDAFRSVPRHCFVPEEQVASAYGDYPLPIGCAQTISQPFMTALMTRELRAKGGDKVLEIGTGCGYQAAILSVLRLEVYSVERFPELAEKAKTLLSSLGYAVAIKVGDGTLGWPEHAPYDRIIITAAASYLPQPLIAQLKIGGRLLIPLGNRFHQELTAFDKLSDDNNKETKICGCVFVPLVGKYGYTE